MTRALRIIGILAFAAVVVLALWMVRSRSAIRTNHISLDNAIHSEVTNALGFAKAHFTGGIGAIMQADPATGVPLIQKVLDGSPAQKAGLRAGDLVIAVGGVSTSGRLLSQNVESIRGFVAGSVTLTIQRQGSTNLQCVIHRSSWKTLGVPN
jgi:S1-C subfamily serine protease